MKLNIENYKGYNAYRKWHERARELEKEARKAEREAKAFLKEITFPLIEKELGIRKGDIVRFITHHISKDIKEEVIGIYERIEIQDENFYPYMWKMKKDGTRGKQTYFFCDVPKLNTENWDIKVEVLGHCKD